jgi:hypothetical protein
MYATLYASGLPAFHTGVRTAGGNYRGSISASRYHSRLLSCHQTGPIGISAETALVDICQSSILKYAYARLSVFTM